MTFTKRDTGQSIVRSIGYRRSLLATAAALALGVITAPPPTSAKPVPPNQPIVSTVAGDGIAGYSGNGGLATAAEANGPCGVAVDSNGNILFSDTNNNVVRAVAHSTGDFYGLKMTAGDIYTVAGNTKEGYRGDGGPARDAQFDTPDGLLVDSAGDIIIGDTTNEVVRYIPAVTGTHLGLAMTAGHVYTVAGDGNYGFSGAGGRAKSAELGLDVVVGLALDADGNLVVTDGDNSVIWVVANATGTFYGQSMTAGDIYIIAGNGNSDYTGDGGPATAAALDEPEGAAFDTSGNLVFVDDSNDVIRVVAEKTGTFFGKKMKSGDIYTVGPKSDANKLSSPEGLAIDDAGNVVFVDAGNNITYLLGAKKGVDQGVNVKPGKVYTIAGNGNTAYTGDGGPARSAAFNTPCGVASDLHGGLLIADSGNNAIRHLTD